MRFEQLLQELTNNLTSNPVQNQAGAQQTNTTTPTSTTTATTQPTNSNQKPDIKVLAQQLSTMNKPEEIEKVLSTLLQGNA